MFQKIRESRFYTKINFFSQPHRVVNIITQVDNRQEVLGYSNTHTTLENTSFVHHYTLM
jgi:hypothetical protein